MLKLHGNPVSPTSERISLTQWICGDPPKGRSALDRRELVRSKANGKSISLGGSIHSGLPGRPRGHGQAFLGSTLDPETVSKSPQAVARAALVIGMDEFFRLALVGVLKTRFDYKTIIEMSAFDRTQDDSIETGGVDLVILESDWGLDCSDSLAGLRRRYPPDTRVIVVSQSARPDDILDALRAGAHGFVPKGNSLADMIQALNAVLNGTLYVPTSLADRINQSHGDISLATKKPETDVHGLTPRQLEVLGYIVQGKSNKQIAKLMSLREGTVKVHVAGLLRNLGVANRSRAAAVGSRFC